MLPWVPPIGAIAAAGPDGNIWLNKDLDFFRELGIELDGDPAT